MGTTDVCIRDDLYAELKELRDTLGLKSFSGLIRLLKDSYLDAPDGVPADVFSRKREAYLGSYPDEFRKTARMCIGVTDPMEFDAVFEETIGNMIAGAEAERASAQEDVMVFQCAHCGHVWDYKGKRNMVGIGQIHCPICQATASRKWLRKLVMPDEEQASTPPP